MKKFAKFALTALIAGMTMAAQASVVIDDFDVNQGVGQLSDSSADGSGVYNSVTGPVSSILGGERDMFITALTTDGFGAQVSTNVSGGLLKYSTDTGASGRSILKWDGVNGVAGVSTGSEANYLATLNPTGLGGLDLAASGSGFKIKVKESDLGFDFAITVYTDATHWTTLVLSSEAHHNFLPDNTPIDFADFFGVANEAGTILSSGALRFTGTGGSADLSSVGAILATINFTGSEAEIDLQIGDVRTVPEPTSIALFGAALLAMGAVRRRKTEVK
jgi:hypothetical protein